MRFAYSIRLRMTNIDYLDFVILSRIELVEIRVEGRSAS